MLPTVKEVDLSGLQDLGRRTTHKLHLIVQKKSEHAGHVWKASTEIKASY